MHGRARSLLIGGHMTRRQVPPEARLEPYRRDLELVEELRDETGVVSTGICPAIRSDGTPCRATGLYQFDGYCVGHSPRVQAARRKGGLQRSTVARLMRKLTPEHQAMDDTMAKAMGAMLAGNLSPAELSALSRAIAVRLQIRADSDRVVEHIEVLADTENQVDILADRVEAKDRRREERELNRKKGEGAVLASAAPVKVQSNGHGKEQIDTVSLAKQE